MRVLLSLICAGVMVSGAEPPALSRVEVCAGVKNPTWIGTPPSEANRLFILEQRTAQIRCFDRTTKKWHENPVLTVDGVQAKENEQGLLGMAFHPQFARNGFIYLYFIAAGGGDKGHIEIARYTLAGEVADPASKHVVLTIDQPKGNHNGGWIAFGPDGYLWLGIGDGGGANDVFGEFGNGQNLNTLRAKILRIDVDVAQQPYGIPPDNPFVGKAGVLPEIAAFGVRNPWRCGFDRVTGDLWIGDVGQNAREEVDVMPKGKLGQNFGWRPREGFIPNSKYPKETPVSPAVDPVLDYERKAGVSITGGFVYRGKEIPSLVGWYVYGDFARGNFWRIDAERIRRGERMTPIEITDQLNPDKKSGNVSTFGEDTDGELFFADYKNSKIYQIVAAP